MNLITQLKIINDEMALAKVKAKQLISMQDHIEAAEPIKNLIDQVAEHLEVASKAMFNEID